jgi:hypothetical protein
MVPPFNLAGPDLQLGVSTQSIEALEKLRDSYIGLQAGEALMEVDQAVLMVVQLTLQQVKNTRSSQNYRSDRELTHIM